jgi:hypothetical protein
MDTTINYRAITVLMGILWVTVKLTNGNTDHISQDFYETGEPHNSTYGIGDGTEENEAGNDTLLQSNDPRKVGFYLYSDPE